MHMMEDVERSIKHFPDPRRATTSFDDNAVVAKSPLGAFQIVDLDRAGRLACDLTRPWPKTLRI
jgi:hypothetical protein